MNQNIRMSEPLAKYAQTGGPTVSANSTIAVTHTHGLRRRFEYSWAYETRAKASAILLSGRLVSTSGFTETNIRLQFCEAVRKSSHRSGSSESPG
jgi:hypothetical protein